MGLDFGFRNFANIDGEVLLTGQELGTLQSLLRPKLRTPDFLRLTNQKCFAQCEKLFKLSSQIAKIEKLQSKRNDELRHWFNKYSKEVLTLIPFLNFIVVVEMVLQEAISSKLKRILERKSKSELLNTYLKDLVFPPRENYPARAMTTLVEITASIQRTPKLKRIFEGTPLGIRKQLSRENKDLLKKLSQFADQYGFLDMEYYPGSPATIDDLISNIKSLLKQDCVQRYTAIHKERKKTEERYNSIISELGIKDDILRLIEDARETLALRQYRADALYMAGYRVRNLLAEIATRLGTDYDHIIFLTYEELLESIEKGQIPDRINLEERKSGASLLFTDNKIEILTGEQLANAKVARTKKVAPVTELAGFVAFPGKYSGRVKIVTIPEETEGVQIGDVLVSPMTDPYYVPAMVKAGAIITDEGGILSHAAIVSRELGIPCIIGTKIATKVLKDNDIVEVDATTREGLVKILRRE